MALILSTVCYPGVLCSLSFPGSDFVALKNTQWWPSDQKKEVDVNSFFFWGEYPPNIIPKYQNIKMSTVVERIGVESVVVPPTNVIGGSTRFKRMIRSEFRIIYSF